MFRPFVLLKNGLHNNYPSDGSFRGPNARSINQEPSSLTSRP